MRPRDGDLDLELVGQGQRAADVVLAGRGHDQDLPARHHVLPGGQGRVVPRPLAASRRLLVRGPALAIVRGVEQGLARVGHRPHQRARVLRGDGGHVQVQAAGCRRTIASGGRRTG